MCQRMHAPNLPGHGVTHFTDNKQRRQLIDHNTGSGNTLCIPSLVEVFYNELRPKILIFPVVRGILVPHPKAEP